MSLLSVVIPVYNEVHTFQVLLEKVKAVVIPDVDIEIIVVDDGSTDGTRDLLKTLIDQHILEDKNVIFLEKNAGKGTALRAGFEICRGDIVLVQDADLEYDPQDYNALLSPILHGDAEVVYGSRILHPQNQTHSALRFYFGGRLVTLVTNLLYGSNLTDEPTCYKVFKKEILDAVPLQCERFEFCPEITAKLLKKGVSIQEVPIRYYPRKPQEGKKIGWLDGIEAIWTLLKYRFHN